MARILFSLYRTSPLPPFSLFFLERSGKEADEKEQGCKKSLGGSFLVHESKGEGERPFCLRCYEGIVNDDVDI